MFISLSLVVIIKDNNIFTTLRANIVNPFVNIKKIRGNYRHFIKYVCLHALLRDLCSNTPDKQI